MKEPSELLSAFLTGGDLCLVDVPCGAGAGALSLLSTVAHLRQIGQLPRQPLNIRLLWGEISAPAISYAVEMLGRVSPMLAEQAIFVSYKAVAWDVLSSPSNVSLAEKVVQSKLNFPQVLLLICNFSSFLERKGKWKEANPGLTMLLQFCSGDLNAGVWIEPNQASVVKALFHKLGMLANKLLPFVRLGAVSPEGVFCDAHFSPPLKNGHVARRCASNANRTCHQKRSLVSRPGILASRAIRQYRARHLPIPGTSLFP